MEESDLNDFLYEVLLVLYLHKLEDVKDMKFLNKVKKTLHDHGIEITFTRSDDGLNFDILNQAQVNLRVIKDVLTLYVSLLLEQNKLRLDDIGQINEELKVNDIPLRIVYHMNEGSSAFRGLEIVEISSTWKELSFDKLKKYPNIQV